MQKQKQMLRQWFQSTPPAEARGDDRWRKQAALLEEFQSTPPAEARGDPR